MAEPYYVRDFLNTPGHHAGAYVLASVDVDDPADEADPAEAADAPLGPRLDARLTVADCGRIATLDFCCYDADDIENALHKARLLQRVVVEFVAALEGHAGDFRRVLERHDGGGTGPGES